MTAQMIDFRRVRREEFTDCPCRPGSVCGPHRCADLAERLRQALEDSASLLLIDGADHRRVLGDALVELDAIGTRYPLPLRRQQS